MMNTDDDVAFAASGWARAHELDAEVHRLNAELAAAWEQAHRLDDALQVYVREREHETLRADGLAVWDKGVDFLHDPRFRRAYAAAVATREHVRDGAPADLDIQWRVHTICWAADHAAKLPGAFVECGVRHGCYSAAACNYVDFNGLDKDFWLFDTFDQIPMAQAEDAEREYTSMLNDDWYRECFEIARANFAAYPRAHLVRGTVPESLATVEIPEVAYLSIDMNLTAPEVAALEWFWPRLVTGAVVVLDDYGWAIHSRQREALDALAAELGASILTLPTGQGLLLKP